MAIDNEKLLDILRVLDTYNLTVHPMDSDLDELEIFSPDGLEVDEVASPEELHAYLIGYEDGFCRHKESVSVVAQPVKDPAIRSYDKVRVFYSKGLDCLYIFGKDGSRIVGRDNDDIPAHLFVEFIESCVGRGVVELKDIDPKLQYYRVVESNFEWGITSADVLVALLPDVGCVVIGDDGQTGYYYQDIFEGVEQMIKTGKGVVPVNIR